MAKIIVTKANSLGVLSHLECVWLRRLHFCCFHWTRRSLPKKFSWDHPKTRLDFEKCPEQKDKSLRTPFASNYDRNRLWDVRQGCQPPPFGGPWVCPRWSAGSGPTSSAFFKSLLRVTYKMLMLISYITCFAIYLATQQCIHFYFGWNISSFMTENNSSRFFLDAWYLNFHLHNARGHPWVNGYAADATFHLYIMLRIVNPSRRYPMPDQT